jgi:hypothetical protein
MTIALDVSIGYSNDVSARDAHDALLQTPDDGRKEASREPYGQPLAKLDFLFWRCT